MQAALLFPSQRSDLQMLEQDEMKEFRQMVVEAAVRGHEYGRQLQRVRQTLRRMDMQLHIGRSTGAMNALERDTMMHKFGPASLDAIEIWAKETLLAKRNARKDEGDSA